MRIATWNVNSLKARIDAVERWLERAEPDVLLMQETKLADDDVPRDAVPDGRLRRSSTTARAAGTASRSPARSPSTDVVTNFGDGPVRDSERRRGVAVGEDDFDPFDEARMVSAVVRSASGSRASTRRTGGSSAARSTTASCAGSSGVGRWLRRDAGRRTEPLVIGGDLNVTPTPDDVWDEVKAHGGTHVIPPEREALADLRALGLSDAYRIAPAGARGRFSWWDYRAGMFHRNEGMRIDLLYVTKPVAKRVVWAEIDREARKGPPIAIRPRAGRRRSRRALASRSKPAGTARWRRIAARTKPQPHRSPAQVRYEEELEAKRRSSG